MRSSLLPTTVHDSATAPSFWAQNKMNICRGTYVAGQWITVFCAFAGTLFSLYDYRHPESRKPENIQDYVINFGLATISASIAAYTANKFQGVKITEPHEDHDAPPRYPYSVAPRNFKSNVAEASYLVFATTLLTVNNYFLIAAIKAAVEAYINPEKIYPLLPLAGYGWLALAIKTFAVDFVFNTTNAHYEAAEEIKEEITGSKAKPLVSRLCYPFVKGWWYTLTLGSVKTAGVFSHTITDYLGLVLSVPPDAWLKLYKSTAGFWSVIAVGGVLSIPLMFVNCIQTLYFEVKESEINLKRIQRERTIPDHYIEHAPKEDNSSFLRSLLTWSPRWKKPIRYGFFSQGPLHAAGDVMSVVLFMQDIFERLEANSGFEISAIVIVAGFVFLTSTWGTHESEVKTAIHHYDEEFVDVGEPTGHMAHMHHH